MVLIGVLGSLEAGGSGVGDMKVSEQQGSWRGII